MRHKIFLLRCKKNYTVIYTGEKNYTVIYTGEKNYTVIYTGEKITLYFTLLKKITGSKEIALYMCSRITYPINCTCCNPAKFLKNYDARKYHDNKMHNIMANNKKRSSASSESPPADAPAPVNKAAVNIFYCNKVF